MQLVYHSDNMGRPKTFVEYYVRVHAHFIPDDVDVWELNRDQM
jgi:hypothetical protein